MLGVLGRGAGLGVEGLLNEDDAPEEGLLKLELDPELRELDPLDPPLE